MNRNDEQHSGRNAGTASAVLADDDVSPIPGLDRRTFENYLGRALDGDDTVPPSIRVRVEEMRGAASEAGAERSREWWYEAFWRHALAEQNREIGRQVDSYLAMAAWHREQAELARGRMGEAADHLAELDGFVTDVNDLFTEQESTGKFNRGRAIALLKARGVEVGPGADDSEVWDLLKREKDEAQRDIQHWTKRYDRAAGDALQHDAMEQENLRKAEELNMRREEIRKAGYGPEEEQRRLRALSAEYGYDVRIKAGAMARMSAPGDAADDRADHGVTFLKKDEATARSEASEFETLAQGLTGGFGAAARGEAAKKPDDKAPEPQPPAASSLRQAAP